MAKKNKSKDEILEEDEPDESHVVEEEVSSDVFAAEYDAKTGRVNKIFIPFGLVGTIFVTRGGSKRQLRYENKQGFVLQDGDRISTEDGYFWSIGMSNEKIKFVLFPQSEIELSAKVLDKGDGDSKSVTHHELTALKLIRGLFWVKIDYSDDRRLDDVLAISQNYPQVEFKPSNGEWGRHKDLSAVIELCNDGNVVIYHMSARVKHKKLGLEGRIGWTGPSKGKITVTNDALYVTDLAERPDPRVKLIASTVNLIGMNKVTSSPKPVEHVDLPLYSLPTDRDRILDRGAKRSIKTSEQISDDFWTEYRRKEDEMHAEAKRIREEYEEETRYAPQATKARELEVLKEKTSILYLEFCKWEKQTRESYKQKHAAFIETGKKQITAISSKGTVNKSVLYQNALFDFLTYETGTGMGLRKATNNQLLLMIKLKMTNKTNKPIFLEPDESIRLFCDGSTTPVPLDNYKFETNPDPGKVYDGHLLFIIPADAKKLSLEFGKKLGPKQNVQFNI